VQTFASSQTTGVPGRQTAAPHVSPSVQALSSSHAAPSASVWKHPVTGSHRSKVQALPSLHAVAVVSVKTQPVAGLQLSAVQMLSSLHTTAPPV